MDEVVAQQKLSALVWMTQDWLVEGHSSLQQVQEARWEVVQVVQGLPPSLTRHQSRRMVLWEVLEQQEQVGDALQGSSLQAPKGQPLKE